GPRVELTGLLPREQVYGRLLDADVFLSTSRIEGLPVAVIEAMACRRPVVLSDIPAHREIAAGADFVPLVPVGDVDGFARELRRLRGLAPAERAAIGERCRTLVQARFDLHTMRAGYERVYREVLGEGSRATTAAR
ncbi:MAG TPA: glycosyltransferase, partial [Candidatus Eisenbacteria bacterium]|nr:glycosyltransferase [Candidatus Eisenbacteria bacterium]